MLNSRCYVLVTPKPKFMKPTFILVIAFAALCSCTATLDFKSEEAAITKVLLNESEYAAKGDHAQWAKCWLNSDDVSFSYTNYEGLQFVNGFQSLSKLIEGMQPFQLKLKRDNFHFSIGNDIAFVSFDQEDNWGGIDRKKKETRTLRKVDNEWKIAHASIVEVSSFTQSQSASYHMPVTSIPKNPRNGFHNISGLGGMSVGYMEVPGPADFTPMFKGLPDDMCSSPHWGYVLDGSLKIRYPGGKEETVKAGEVFYWPAPHTGIVEKNVKFIDFSPDGKFNVVMDHLAKRMKEMAAK